MNTKEELDRLRRVLAHIDANPESLDMRTIAHKSECGTTCCIAGHAVALEGRAFIFDEDGYTNTTTRGENVWDLAALLLGLTEDEQYDLFHSGNDRQDIQRIAEQIAIDAGEIL